MLSDIFSDFLKQHFIVLGQQDNTLGMVFCFLSFITHFRHSYLFPCAKVEKMLLQ